MSSSAEDLWRGQSSATRAAERRERLLAAGMQLMGTQGASETTVRGVCREAGVGLRYFYESFADIDALVGAVYDRTADALTEAVLAQVATVDDAQAKGRAAFEAVIAFTSADPRRGRILFRETLVNDTVRAHGTESMPRFVALVAAALLGVTVAEFTADTTYRRELQISALSGALVKLFLDWQSDRLGVPQAQLVEYCTELMWAVIGR